MPRPQTARRGRGNFKGNNSQGQDRDVHQRLGKVVYTRAVNINERRWNKYVKSPPPKESVVSLPAEQRLKTLTKKFIKSYYEAFDQDGRKDLETLYSAEAFLSCSATHPMPTTGRNLLEVRDAQQRVQMLIHGRTAIAQALASFPPSKHIENYQTVDIPYFTANPMSIASIHAVVNGVFDDTSQQTNSLRAFTRVFVLKHVSTDMKGEPVYQIFNDIFMLQEPTADQIKKYLQDQQALKRLAGVDKPTTTSGLQSKKELLIKSIMAKTKMNREGSEKLLTESDWDEQKSMNAFNTLYPQNLIPAQFFER